MRKLLLLVILLSGCTLIGNIGGDSWARAIFTPTPAAREAVCDRAARATAAANSLETVTRDKSFSITTPRGPITVVAGLGPIKLLCGFAGLVTGRVPDVTKLGEFETSILFNDPALNPARTKVSLEFETEKEGVLGTVALNEVTTEGQRNWFSAASYSTSDLKMLDAAQAFTIIVERGSGQERYRVTPREYPAAVTTRLRSGMTP